MGEVESLLVTLAAIYAAECLVWVPLGALTFSTLTGARWRLRQPGALAGNARGGFVLAHPLPPLGRVLLARQFPLSLSPEGVCAWQAAGLNGWRRPPQSAAWMHYDDITQIASQGRKLLLNGQVFLRTGSEGYARFAASALRRIRQTPPAQRAEVIRDFFAGQLDLERVAARLQELQRRSGVLRWLANAVFVSVFAVFPAVVWQFGLRRFLLWMAAAVLVQTTAAAILYYRAHKALMPEAAEERFSWLLTMLLAAPTAMRAHDLLARRALETFHPLAVGKVLLNEEAFRRLAREVLRDQRYPIEPACPSTAPEARAIAQWSGAAWQEALDGFLLRCQMPPAELLAPPAPQEPCHRAFCPRCRAQFVVEAGVCAECGGRPLERFFRTATRDMGGRGGD